MCAPCARRVRDAFETRLRLVCDSFETCLRLAWLSLAALFHLSMGDLRYPITFCLMILASISSAVSASGLNHDLTFWGELNREMWQTRGPTYGRNGAILQIDF